MRISDWSSDVCSSDLVPTAIENCRRLQLVVRVHLLDTDCQGYVGEPGPEHHRGLMERRGAARASILDVDDRDFRETHASQVSLTTDGMLPFHDPDRKSVVEGKSVSVRLDIGGPRSFQKKKSTK